MQKTERHIIKQGNQDYPVLDELSFLVKNLYNSALYDVRQHYFKTKNYKHHNSVINDFTKNNQPDYIALPRKVSQQTIRLVGQNFRAFFGSLKSKKNNNTQTKVRIPKYLPKDGRFMVTFPKDTLSKKVTVLGNGLFEHTLCARELNLKIKSRIESPDMVRIVPRGSYYIIEIVYTVVEAETKKDNGRYASIDLGLNNLMAVYFNTSARPLLYNGRSLKSVNQFYNKKKAKLQSLLGGEKKTSNNIKKLSLKRNNKIEWLLHNATRDLVNRLVSEDISCLIIGLNKDWKQDINLGKRNNQNFVQIPFSKLISQLQYKCAEVGIKVVMTEESYTSKCSALDREKVGKHAEYVGKRLKRGLFKTATKFFVNADVNGSMNIMRKVVPDDRVLFEGIEVVVGQPVMVKSHESVGLS